MTIRKADITVDTHHAGGVGAGRSRDDARKAQEALRNLARKAVVQECADCGSPSIPDCFRLHHCWRCASCLAMRQRQIDEDSK